MHRIDTSTRSVDANGSGKDGFTNGVPFATPPTSLTADFFNDAQEELCNVIEDQGITLVKGTKTQLLDAIDRRLTKFALSNLTKRTNGGNFDLEAVAFGNGYFVAVGQADGVNAYIVTSPDGHQWQERGNPKNFGLRGVCFGANLFVAVGEADGTDAYIVTSPDGVTWTERTNPKNVWLHDVTYGGGVFVACGSVDTGDSYLISSTDGINWTERSHARNTQLNSITHNGTIFVAVGYDDLTDSYCITSSDGLTWFERATPKRSILTSVAWGNGLFVAVGRSSAGFGDALFTSPDAITWTDRSTAVTAGLITPYSLCFAAGVFVITTAPVVTVVQSRCLIGYSFDGITWATLPAPYEFFGYDRGNGISYGHNMFIFAGTEDNGAEAALYTSLANPF